jgi:hypothetical protein
MVVLDGHLAKVTELVVVVVQRLLVEMALTCLVELAVLV